MRVNRPSPTRRTPVASGSSVPAWPTRRCEKVRRQRATASCEVQPGSLSTTTMPIVSTPSPPLVRVGIVTVLGVVIARGLSQRPEDLLHPQPVGHGRIRLEPEQWRALHAHLAPDDLLELSPLLGEGLDRGRGERA